ncbi:hypothetical protein [Streptomyces murinus]|uniref:hypothetical protein n=1 Tax=Streptomyces murinus TaxID=33900 RepID=UPI002E151E71|nr:hypothetical protein OG516_11635 [Streptomyces murinus]
MLIGYARASTADQNPDYQIGALLCHGIDHDTLKITRLAVGLAVLVTVGAGNDLAEVG